MAERSIDLVIRARDEAKATLAAISAELKNLGSSQDAAGKSAASSGSLIARFAQEITNLKKTTDGIQSFNKVAQQIDGIGSSLAGIHAKAEDATLSLSKLKETQVALTEQSKRQKAALDATSAAYNTQAQAADRDAAALKKVDTEINRVQNSLNKQQAKIGPPTQFQQGRIDNNRDRLSSLQTTRAALPVTAQPSTVDLERESANMKAINSSLRETEGQINKTESSLKTYTRSIQTLTAVGKELSDEAIKVGTALGIDITQMDGAAAAAARNAAQQERLANILSRVPAANAGRFGTGGPAAEKTSNYRAQQAALADVSAQYQKAQEELTKLGAATRGGTQGTVEQIAAYQRAKDEVTLLNAEYKAEAAILNALKASIATEAAARQASNAATREAAAAERQAAQAMESANAIEQRGIEIKQADEARLRALTQRYQQYAEAVDKGGARAATAAGGFDTLITKIGAYVSAYQLLKDATTDAIDYEAAQVRVTLALGKSTEEGAQAFQNMADHAEALKLQIVPAVDQYGKFLSAIHGTVLEGPKGTQIFADLLTAARAFKLDPSNISRATLALRDMAANGNVNLRYLRQLDQALPIGLLSRFATAAGYSGAQLHKFFDELHKGNVSLDILPKVFADAAAGAEKGLPAALKTAQSALVDFQNALLKAQLAFTEGGFFDGLVSGLNAVNAELRRPEAKEALGQLGGLFGDVLKILTALVPYAKEIVIVLGGLASIKLAASLTGFGDLAGLFAAATASARASVEASLAAATATERAAVASAKAAVAKEAETAATIALAEADSALAVAETEAAVAGTAMSAAIGFLTGPAGIILGLGAIITGVTLFKSRTTEASGAGDAFAKVLDDIKKSANDASEAVKNLTRLDAQKAFPKLQAAFDDSKDSLSYEASLKNSRFRPGGTGAAPQEIGGLREFAKALNEGKIPLDEAQERFEKLNAALTTDAAKDYANKLADPIEALIKTGVQLGTTAQALAKYGDTSDAVAKAQNLVKDQLTGIIASQKPLEDSTDKAAQAWEEYQKALDSATKAFPELRREQKLTEQQTDILNLKLKAQLADIASGAAVTDGRKGQEEVTGPATREANTKISEINQAALEKGNSSVPGYNTDLDNLVQRIIGAESGGRNVKNPDSSASGLGQFTDGTFRDQFKKVYPEYQGDPISAGLKNDRTTVEALMKNYLKELDAGLPKRDDISPTLRQYVGYFGGAGGGKALLSADRGTSVRDAYANAGVSSTKTEQAIAANPTILGGNVGQALDRLAKAIGGGSKLDSKGQTYNERNDEAGTKRIAELDEKTKGINADNYLPAKTNAQNRAAVDYLHSQTDEQGKQLQTEEQLNDAQKRTLATIKEKAGAEYDAAHAQEAERKVVQDLLGMQEQLKTAYADLKTARSEGNKGDIDDQTAKIAELKAKIEETIPKARQLATAFGDESGKASIDKVTTGMGKLEDQSSGTARTIRDEFTGDALSAIDGFFSDVETGVKPFQALEKAAISFFSSILKQLANKLLTSALNSLFGGGNTGSSGNVGGIAGSLGKTVDGLNGAGGGSGGGGLFSWIGSLFGGGSTAAAGATAGAASGGGGIFSFLASLFHGGGEVGSSGISRSVNPMAFINAPRFHDGGFPGLASDEIPVVAQRGERIMTKAQQAADAKAKANAGSSNGRPLTNILALGDDQVAAAMSGAHGEDVTLSHLRRNLPTVKKWLGG